MTYSYIQLSNDAGSTYKKYDLAFTSSPVIPIPDTPSEYSATLNGDSVVSFGASKNFWKLELQVIKGDTRSGYGTLADALGLFSSVTAAANNIRLRLMDYDTVATTYQTVLTNKTRPELECLSVDHYAADAVYRVGLELRQI
jgi:hypothetical protein